MDDFKPKIEAQTSNQKPISETGGFGYSQKNKEAVIYSEENGSKKSLSPKFTFGVLLILASATLIYGFVSLAKNIYGPKVLFDQNQQEILDKEIEQSSIVNDLLELQNSDTDKDGLNDYEEMYIFKTSPYLPDTDSDGYFDKQEIDDGYDPLCPKGQDCRGVTETTQDSGTTATGFEELNQEAPSEELPQEVIDELNKLGPDEIRQLLLESGQMTQEDLDLIDDATLIQIFQEVLNQ